MSMMDRLKRENVRIISLIASKNDLKLILGDVTEAYLYSSTKEKFYIKANRDFGKYAGKFLIIHKSLKAWKRQKIVGITISARCLGE